MHKHMDLIQNKLTL